MGGGLVGLWTAIRAKQKAPQLRISVLESDFCGSGASGRNGGFVLSYWPKISSLLKLLGKESALRVAKDSESAISEIGAFCREHQINADFRQSGWIWTATSAFQEGAWNSVLKTCESLGVAPFQRLSSQEVQQRTGSKVHRAGIYDPSAAFVHPAKWVMGLRRVALDLGVEIFENTRVKKFTRSQPVEIQTEQGSLRAQTLVIATNAWAASIKELARSLVAITSDMIVTAPAKTEIEACGWRGGEGITDSQTMVDYYQVTADHRIAFGKGGWGIAWGGCLGKDFDVNEHRAATVEEDFRRYYPSFKDVEITHHWCGPIDRTPHSLPLLGGFDHHPNIIYGVGWSGNGVGPSKIGGEILSSLALQLKDEWSDYPLVGKSVGLFPPEPIRYLGAHIVRNAVARKERREIQGLHPHLLDVAISKLAPAGLEDKE